MRVRAASSTGAIRLTAIATPRVNSLSDPSARRNTRSSKSAAAPPGTAHATGEHLSRAVEALFAMRPAERRKRFDAQRSALMRGELERLVAMPGVPDFAVGILQHLLAQ